MQADCSGVISTDPTSGVPMCTDGAGTVVAWQAVAPFDPAQLDPASITAYFAWGWFIVAMGWVIGKGVSLFVQFVKNAF